MPDEPRETPRSSRDLEVGDEAVCIARGPHGPRLVCLRCRTYCDADERHINSAALFLEEHASTEYRSRGACTMSGVEFEHYRGRPCDCAKCRREEEARAAA